MNSNSRRFYLSTTNGGVYKLSSPLPKFRISDDDESRLSVKLVLLSVDVELKKKKFKNDTEYDNQHENTFFRAKHFLMKMAV